MKNGFGILVVLGLIAMPGFSQVGMFDKAADWTLTTAGNVKEQGKATVSGTNYTLEGNGDDIWNTADEGYFIYTEKTGSFSISALLFWEDPGTDPWSKMIVMVREKGDLPGSKNYGTQLRGNLFGDQTHATMRLTENGASNSTQFFEPANPSVAVQATVDGLWVRTTRIAELNLFLSEWSYDGKTWNLAYNAEIPMQDQVAAGLAITSHTTDDYLVLGTFKSVAITSPVTLPAIGTRTFSDGGFKAGDTIDISLKVLNPNKAAATLKVDDTVPAGWTISGISNNGTASGSTVSWNLNAEFGYTTITYRATAPAKPGFENTWNGTVGTQKIGGSASLSVVQDKPEGDQIFAKHADIFRNLSELGGEGLLGSATYDPTEKVYTVSGAGWDIWDTYDEFHFLYTELSGDFTFTARILHDESARSTSTDGWIKGMLMARQNLTAGSPNFGNRVRRDGQYSWQMRAAQNGSSSSDGNNRVTFTSIGYDASNFPLVRVERTGDQWKIFYKDERGTGNWIQVQSTQTLHLEDPILVGLAVTAHQTGSIQYTWFKEVSLEVKGPVAVPDWSLY